MPFPKEETSEKTGHLFPKEIRGKIRHLTPGKITPESIVRSVAKRWEGR